MSLRDFLLKLDKEGKLVKINDGVSSDYEIAQILNRFDGQVVLFENVKNTDYQVVGGLCSSRETIADALNIKENEIVRKLAEVSKNLTEPEIVAQGECQEVVETEVDLTKIPILRHLKKDGGTYITSGVCIVKDLELGRNMSIHRMMVIGKNKLVARIVENRGTDTAMKKTENLEIAICIGNSIPVLLSAATSLEKGKDELSMANSLEKVQLVKCKTVDLEVPKDCEMVLEGVITNERHVEGPFLDLTGTYDKVREQPVIEIKCITHRKNPIHQALLPAKKEHKILMGMPREPTIFNEINKVCNCEDICLTEGGCSWLHAVVQIDKKNVDDGRRAIEATFKGHGSLKHCVIVDKDINIRNPQHVEWAIATRAQMDRDLILYPDQPGSSLDPSAELNENKKAITCKAGIDATIPNGKNKKSFAIEKYE